jgi:branched-chain amino acid aminotransferase
VKNGVVRTNMLAESILEGITRSTVLEIAADLGYPTQIAPFSKEEVFGADEAFFSGTAVEITPVIRVTDGSDPEVPATEHIIGSGRPGAVTCAIENAFRKAVAGKTPRYEKWLTYVD